MRLELADISEAQEINDLLNLAYRGEKGWTTECSLVDGDRSTVSNVEVAIKNSIFLTYKKEGVLVSCVCIEPNGCEAYIGSFAVHPEYQACGLGASVLSAAEYYAGNELNIIKFTLVVLSVRSELISFYERRGYHRTGIHQKYPQHLNVGTPKVSGLAIVQLCKHA